MSTMYDALKKAEAERKKAAGPGSVLKDSKDGADMLKNNQVMILLIAVIIVSSIAFYRIKASIDQSKVMVPVQKTIVPQADMPAKSSTVQAAPMAEPQRAPGTYALDGIIEAGENSIAIINGKLIKLDGTIDDLVLKKISSKEADLLNTKDNSTVVLKIQ